MHLGLSSESAIFAIPTLLERASTSPKSIVPRSWWSRMIREPTLKGMASIVLFAS